jgi:hypothetical protein
MPETREGMRRRNQLGAIYMKSKDPRLRRKLSSLIRGEGLPRSRFGVEFASHARLGARLGMPIEECRHCGGLYPMFFESNYWCSMLCEEADHGSKP